MRGPAAVHRQSCASDRGCRIACKKHCESAQLLDGGEALVRLLREQYVADNLFARDSVRLGLTVDLCFDQRRIDVAWADCVAGDVGFSGLERDDLGQSDDAVFRRHIGRLERRGDQTMRRSDIDDPAEVVLTHQWQRSARGMER
jgi:hypothetical protein